MPWVNAMDERNDSRLREALDRIEAETARKGILGRREVMAGIVSFRACRYKILRNADDHAAAFIVPKRDFYI